MYESCVDVTRQFGKTQNSLHENFGVSVSMKLIVVTAFSFTE